MRLIKDNYDKIADSMVRTIFSKVKDFAGSSPQYDNMTIICLKADEKKLFN